MSTFSNTAREVELPNGDVVKLHNGVTENSTSNIKKFKYDDNGHVTESTAADAEDLNLSSYSTPTTGTTAIGTSDDVQTAIGKLDHQSQINQTNIAGKVDKVSGKGLSTEDFTTTEKNKLSGIEANANDYVHPTTSGYKHIPSGGSSGKILGWDSDGTAKWVDPTGGGDVSSVKVGTETYNPDSNGVVSLPAYPTTLPASDVSSWAKESSKPKYTASEVGAIATTAKGAANGVASLDSSGKVPSSQLPSYVDDVLEYSAKSSFPSPGESGKIYVDTTTNKTYRWGGSAYVEISESLALGDTASTAYYGNKGKTAYEHSQVTSGNPHNVTKTDVGLSNVGNFKAVSTVASQGLTDTEKSNARANIGAGTSSFSGSYSDLSNKPTLGTASAKDVPSSGNASTSQVVMGNDSRLSDARTPTSHTHTKSQITDFPCDIPMGKAKPKITLMPERWSTLNWGSASSAYGAYIWNDGINIYCSGGSARYQFVLNRSPSLTAPTWESKTWSGLTSFYGGYIWTDGTDFYYSYDDVQYYLDKGLDSTWSPIHWIGLTSFDGDRVWTDGSNIYYSAGSTQYVLDKSSDLGHTWSAKTWSGLTSFSGDRVWTDGSNIYYSGGSTQYVLDKATSTWAPKTWSGLTSFSGEGVWTDGSYIYYSFGSNQYVLDKESSTWRYKSWTDIDPNYLSAPNIWSDGENVYHSYSIRQYVLEKLI